MTGERAFSECLRRAYEHEHGKRFNRHTVADIAGVSNKMVKRWERGLAVPDSRALSRLTAMLPQFFKGAVPALVEPRTPAAVTDAARNPRHCAAPNPLNPVLKQQEREALQVELETQAKSEAVPAPHAVVPQNHRLQPGGGRSVADASVRREFARRMLTDDPRARNSDINDAMRATYGLGIDQREVGILRRELGVGIRKRSPILDRLAQGNGDARPAVTSYRKAEAVAKRRAVASHQKQAPVASSDAPARRDIKKAIAASLQMLFDEHPELRRLEALNEGDGKPVSFNFQARVLVQRTEVEHGDGQL